MQWAYYFSKATLASAPNDHKNAEIALIPPSGRQAPKSSSQALELN